MSGSFDGTRIRKWCGPPMPSDMLVVIETSLLSPGLRVARPATAEGGQHPSRASTAGNGTVSVSTASPALRNVYACVTATP